MADSFSCPRCGGTMVAAAVPSRREFVKMMVTNGSTPAYATVFVDAVHEKHERLGLPYTCGACRYVRRSAPKAAAPREMPRP